MGVIDNLLNLGSGQPAPPPEPASPGRLPPPPPHEPLDRPEARRPPVRERPTPPTHASSLPRLPPSRVAAPIGMTRPPPHLPFARDLPEVDPDFAAERSRAGAAFGPDRDARAGQAMALLERNGVKIVAGGLYVVQIDQDSPPPPPPLLRKKRGVTREDLRANQAERREAHDLLAAHLMSYTGQAVAFRAQLEDDGTVRLLELNKNGPYASSSHPGQFTYDASKGNKAGVPNFDHDKAGTPDIGTLRAGAYTYYARSQDDHFGPTSNLPAARDLDGNGAVDAAENRRTANATATDVDWHPGLEGKPSSVLCQNLKASHWKEFSHIIESAGVDTFTYLLVRRDNDTTGASPVQL